MIRKIFLPFFILCGFIAAVGAGQTAHAGVTGFVAGHIIDDGVFTNTISMSVADIQNFLNSKVPACDTYGTQMYNSWQTRAQFAATIGQHTPFTCLKDYNENGRSAARIIFDTAQQYQINPQVLLVLLQKEQALVTDSWPYATQYQRATGYRCPDTAPCDSLYFGFSNQLKQAANMFHQIMVASPYWYTPYILGNNFIRYSPTVSCGGSNVYIENRATQALYNYTPYQPNQASLDAGWGSASSCGAYGNRNFYLYFTSWFGSTTRPYYATYAGQTPAISTTQGDTSGVVLFRFTNAGSQTWYDDSSAASGVPRVHLATSFPTNRSSIFAKSWASPARPAVNFSAVYESNGTTLAANQHVVQPGQVAVFTVRFSVPTTITGGNYSEVFQPVADGSNQWDMGATVETGISVVDKYRAVLTSQSTTKVTGFQNNVADQAVVLRFKNVGYAAWYDDISASADTPRVHLATSGPVNRKSRFSASWPTAERPGLTFAKVYESDGITPAANQHIAQPGQIVEYSVSFTVPDSVGWGNYYESFRVVADGSDRWDATGEAGVNVRVNAVNHVAVYAGQSNYPVISPGLSGTGYVSFRNTGNSVWFDDVSAPKGLFPVHLATDSPVNRFSNTASPEWINPARPTVTFSAVYESDTTTLAANQHTVLPGQIARFNITFVNKSIPLGSLSREAFIPVLEGSHRWNISLSHVWLDILSR